MYFWICFTLTAIAIVLTGMVLFILNNPLVAVAAVGIAYLIYRKAIK